MKQTYNISGMTCNNCVSKVKSELLKMGDVTEADVQLKTPQATITMQKHIPAAFLQTAVNKAGNYKITEADNGMHQQSAIEKDENKGWLAAYKPILLIFAYITGITIFIEFVNVGFNWMRWMQNFMAAFFLTFSYFKLLNLKGFAESYSTYDVIAKRWTDWGYIYGFIELGLGLAYLTGFNPLVTNATTFVIMSISIIGVLQSVLNKRKIKCACLGAVFNLPMSTITIIEDALMIAMSGIMFFVMF